MDWSYEVDGTQPASGTVERAYVERDEVTVSCEGSGEALAWLLDSAAFWDNIDQSKPLTIRVIPAGTAYQPRDPETEARGGVPLIERGGLSFSPPASCAGCGHVSLVHDDLGHCRAFLDGTRAHCPCLNYRAA